MHSDWESFKRLPHGVETYTRRPEVREDKTNSADEGSSEPKVLFTLQIGKIPEQTSGTDTLKHKMQTTEAQIKRLSSKVTTYVYYAITQ